MSTSPPVRADLEPLHHSQPPAVVYTEADYQVSDETRRLVAASVSEETRRAYARIWDGTTPKAGTPSPPGGFVGWCLQYEDGPRVPLPATPQTLADYVSHLAAQNRAPSSIRQAMAAVRTMHRVAGYRGQPDTEAALAALRGYRKERRARPRRAAPILIPALKRMLATCDLTTFVGLRDAVLLVFGVAVYARRSELTALDLDNLTSIDEGVLVYIAASKTDQDAIGEEIAVPRYAFPDLDCVVLLRQWRSMLAEHGILEGPFLWSVSNQHGRPYQRMTPQSVNLIVQHRALLAGLDYAEQVSAHSLRAGGCTIGAENGASYSALCRQGRWLDGSVQVLIYVRGVQRWSDNPFVDRRSRDQSDS